MGLNFMSGFDSRKSNLDFRHSDSYRTYYKYIDYKWATFSFAAEIDKLSDYRSCGTKDLILCVAFNVYCLKKFSNLY
jgi:hypothetical protein